MLLHPLSFSSNFVYRQFDKFTSAIQQRKTEEQMWAKVLRKVVSAGPLASAAPRLRAMPAPAAVSGYAGAGAALGGRTRHYSDTRPLSEIQLQHLEGSNSGIATILMNRPHARNSLGKVFVMQLEEIIEDLQKDKSVRVVLFKSQIKGVFCAASLPMPTIAAIDGFALGGGLELALACDLRVAASSAKMGLIEVTRGLLPGAGGSQRLPRIVGINKAKELIFTGRQVDGKQAVSIGLVNDTVTQNDVGDAAYQKALDLAKEILPQGPVAVRMAKQAMNRGIEVDVTSGMAIEEMCYAQVIPTKDRLEGMAAFKEKRLPHFTGK
ncbi:enoyl-CoA hydratase domain-containing protein 2, mitochondrial isoform X2 [Amblyraja radiata]|uniref:enoyl-CoA hydratase domain-containing protein 2, mitochondrial isoform X2 n=1 Tax=Amblyraja radiata TaxID=386614 RepID=UPI0014035B9E|nr:enoyl-CoA hydratase domain-containing protein 2, mitochondrial isoform X2 [Amblyraja radiata]